VTPIHKRNDIVRIRCATGQGINGNPRCNGRLSAMPQAVYGSRQKFLFPGLRSIGVTALFLPGERKSGDAPFDIGASHLFHFFTVTVVPSPFLETIANTSMMRLQPGSPKPRPLPVE